MNASVIAILLQRSLLEVWMKFDLVYRGGDGAFFAKYLEVVHIKICHADRADLATLLQSLHIAPCRGEVPIKLEVAAAVWPQGKQGRSPVWIHRDWPANIPFRHVSAEDE